MPRSMSLRPGVVRRGVFLAVIVLLLWILAEVVSAGVLWARRGEAPLPQSLLAMRRAALAAAPAAAAGLGAAKEQAPDGGFPTEAIHPYLGFVLDPATGSVRTLVTPHGFFSTQSRLERQRPEPRFEVAVTGGSVATGFCFGARKEFLRVLEPLALTQGKLVTVRCFALGGYKQPQQLMALQWALVQGQRFDLVINLDGFNEVALPAAENLKQGLHPFYPRSWRLHSNDLMSPEELLRVGEIAVLSAERRQRVSMCSRGALVVSPLCHLVWSSFDSRLAARLVELESARQAAPATRRTFAGAGPEFRGKKPAELYPELARLWAESSLLMHQTLTARGVPYFHFLQPNQYVDGSKVMGALERQVAFNMNHPYREPVVRGYPELIREGERLRQAGVQFFDLTRLFADHPEPLYEDSCCHYNQAGNDLLGAAVGEIVAGNLAAGRLAAAESGAK
jgi:hypothetical protein